MSAQEESAVSEVVQPAAAVEPAAAEKRPNVTYLDELKPKAEEAPKTEQPKAAQAEESKQEAAAEEAAEHERDEKGRFKSPKLQERFDELTRQRHEATREAAYWRGIAESRAAQESKPAAEKTRPDASQFQDYGQYVEALTDWKAKEHVDQRMAEFETRQQSQAKATSWHQRVEAAKSEIPDVEQVLSRSEAPLSPAMAEVIQTSAQGPKIAVFLAQHPEDSARISKLHPLAAAVELGKIEASMSAPQKVEKRITSAPKPASTVGSGRSTEGDPSKMSMDDYIAWRNAQRKQR